MANGPVSTSPETYLSGDQYPPQYELIRIITSFLKAMFARLPVGSYRYSDNEADTEIWISADTPINPTKVGQRPAITVLRAHMAYQGIGIGDRAHVDWRTGQRVEVDIVPTTILVNVLSQLPVEAERLAYFAVKQIRGYREEIIRAMPRLINIGPRPGISAPSPAGTLVDSTEHEWSVVVVSFPVFLNDVLTITPLNKKILQSMQTTVTTSSGVTAPVKPLAGLQGTSVAQVQQSSADRAAALSLPLNTPSEAESSSEPLTVIIKT